jgi:hypothetical protein
MELPDKVVKGSGAVDGLGVHVGSMVEQDLYRRQLALASGHMQRRPSVVVLRVDLDCHTTRTTSKAAMSRYIEEGTYTHETYFFGILLEELDELARGDLFDLVVDLGLALSIARQGVALGRRDVEALREARR